VNERDNTKKSAAYVADFLRGRLQIPTALLDIIICLLLAALGVWFVVQAVELPAGRTMIGVGTFPLITSTFLVALCMVQIVLSLRNFRAAGTTVFDRPLAVPIGMVLLLLFPFSMDKFGYFQTAAIWIPGFAWVAGVTDLRTILVLTTVILALALVVFKVLLGTPLP
jgi:hypothetical protein